MKKAKYDRRKFIKIMGCGAISAAAAQGVLSCISNNNVKPNILWISCEDISPHLGCYGYDNAVTPVLDNLASEGVRFENAFSVASVCAPTRSGIITGIYPTSLGTHHMRAGGEGVQRSVKPNLPSHIKCFSEYLRGEGYYCTNNYKEDYNFDTPESAWDESSNKAHWKNNPDKNSPFFAVLNYQGTHEGSLRLDDEGYAKMTHRLTPAQRQNPEKLMLPPYYPDTKITRRFYARYYELITGLDYWVGDILKQLEEDGLSENTIVFFWSDHGIGMPRAKRWANDSGTHIPLIVRIPEKFRKGSQGRPGTVDEQPVSTCDFAQTVLNLTGIKIPEYMQGRAFLGSNLTPERKYIYGARDRMDERYDIVRSVRDKQFRYIRNYQPYKPYFQHMQSAESGPVMQELRRLHKSGKLPPAAEIFMASKKPAEELYDIVNDPHEINNLAENPKYKDVIERMREAHIEWMLETGDLGFIPEPELVEIEKKYGNRYEFLLQPGNKNLLRKILNIALTAGRPEISDMEVFVEALKDENAPVRYWAVIGLANLVGHVKKHGMLLKDLLGDKSPIVRVASAGALCKMGMETAALPVLVKELKNENEWVRLNAAIELDNLGEKARPAVNEIKEALKDKDNKYVVRVANHALNKLLGKNNKVR